MQAIPGLPHIQPGDDLAALITQSLPHPLQDGDILVVSSKIVSKAEGRFVDLNTVSPSEKAQQIAGITLKDARIIELALHYTDRVSRTAPHVFIVRHKLGFTSANAGIDQSNVGFVSQNIVLLLPENPDKSARELRSRLEADHGVQIGVIINDTHGRPFRTGNVGVAIGIAGVPALLDQRGQPDLFGRTLQATLTPLADELAAAAGLISGQADEGQPVVLIRGVAWQPAESDAVELIRPPDQDLYL
jgi:coenzyme F420-0:L-glutamate ligase/coenzyme F420-1:gamma-L-glutamate ligase